METPELLSTRLDKKRVYTLDDMTGLSKKCDIFMFNNQILFINYFPHPRYFFISTHSSGGLFYFIKSVLPTLKNHIVLILASEDITFPTGQKDVRYDDYGYKYIQRY